jgi:hypothetical protein
MSASHLVVVPSPGEAESSGDRIRRLQAEARSLAREQIEVLAATLNEVARMAAEIADGGELYPVGIRELSRRLADEAPKHAMSLAAIAERREGSAR